jgi:hypothetical protein
LARLARGQSGRGNGPVYPSLSASRHRERRCQ